MSTTPRKLIERVKRHLEGDIVSPTDSRYTDRYILEFINEGVAVAAKKSAIQNGNLEGITYASDSFNFTYKDLTIQTDSSTGQKYVDLPALPIDLPKNRSLVRLVPSGSFKNTLFKPIMAKDISKYLNLPSPPSMTFYYVEEHRAKFLTCNSTMPVKVNITMITGAAGLDDPLMLPLDSQAEVVQYVLNILMREKPQDLTNDSTNIDTVGTAS